MVDTLDPNVKPLIPIVNPYREFAMQMRTARQQMKAERRLIVQRYEDAIAAISQVIVFAERDAEEWKAPCSMND